MPGEDRRRDDSEELGQVARGSELKKDDEGQSRRTKDLESSEEVRGRSSSEMANCFDYKEDSEEPSQVARGSELKKDEEDEGEGEGEDEEDEGEGEDERQNRETGSESTALTPRSDESSDERGEEGEMKDGEDKESEPTRISGSSKGSGSEGEEGAGSSKGFGSDGEERGDGDEDEESRESGGEEDEEEEGEEETSTEDSEDSEGNFSEKDQSLATSFEEVEEDEEDEEGEGDGDDGDGKKRDFQGVDGKEEEKEENEERLELLKSAEEEPRIAENSRPEAEDACFDKENCPEQVGISSVNSSEREPRTTDGLAEERELRTAADKGSEVMDNSGNEQRKRKRRENEREVESVTGKGGIRAPELEGEEEMWEKGLRQLFPQIVAPPGLAWSSTEKGARQSLPRAYAGSRSQDTTVLDYKGQIQRPPGVKRTKTDRNAKEEKGKEENDLRWRIERQEKEHQIHWKRVLGWFSKTRTHEIGEERRKREVEEKCTGISESLEDFRRLGELRSTEVLRRFDELKNIGILRRLEEINENVKEVNENIKENTRRLSRLEERDDEEEREKAETRKKLEEIERKLGLFDRISETFGRLEKLMTISEGGENRNNKKGVGPRSDPKRDHEEGTSGRKQPQAPKVANSGEKAREARPLETARSPKKADGGRPVKTATVSPGKSSVSTGSTKVLPRSSLDDAWGKYHRMSSSSLNVQK